MEQHWEQLGRFVTPPWLMVGGVTSLMTSTQLLANRLFTQTCMTCVLLHLASTDRMMLLTCCPYTLRSLVMSVVLGAVGLSAPLPPGVKQTVWRCQQLPAAPHSTYLYCKTKNVLLLKTLASSTWRCCRSSLLLCCKTVVDTSYE